MQKWTVRAALSLLHGLYLLLAISASAVEPADARIKAALYDIDRYEKQFAGKTSERATVVRRVLKLLTISRGKLGSCREGVRVINRVLSKSVCKSYLNPFSRSAIRFSGLVWRGMAELDAISTLF
jgi:hypothetical protein